MATVAHAIRYTLLEGEPRRAGLPLRLLVATSAVVVACLAWTAAAFAAPANDAFSAATPISGLPFSDTVDMAGATTESGEPQFCYPSDQTSWYAFTPTHDGTLAASTAGSSAYGQVTAYSSDGSGITGLSFLDCQNFGGKAVFEVHAGVTYYLQASDVFGWGGTVHVTLDEQLPPPNDDFANATAIGSLPFSGSVDMTAATVQDGEPATCQGIPAQTTAWYAFTPPQSGSYVIGTAGYGQVAAYSGSALSSLTQVACGSWQTVFRAEAGRTYYLQLAGSGYGGTHQLTLDDAPPAQASFYSWPSDPSSFDLVSFYDYSSDIAGIASRSWNLGDGFTRTTRGSPS